MSHQDPLERTGYKDWVKGGLTFKYFKDGIQQYAEQIVLSDHSRILQQAGVSSGLICGTCNFRDLRPLHKKQPNPSNSRDSCPWAQKNCNCLFPFKKRKCPIQICDFVYEEVLKSHASTPPSPEWKNTDITKWTTNPWEIAKCFINAPGYSGKNSAASIDITGLLHFFINNMECQRYFPNTKVEAFVKIRERRHLLFHSPSMTLETAELDTLINDIISILQDGALKSSKDATDAVNKLKELQTKDFYITTHREADVLKTAIEEISKKMTELNTLIEETRQEISENQEQALQKISTAQEKGTADLSWKLQQAVLDISARQYKARKEISFKHEQVTKDINAQREKGITEITYVLEKACGDISSAREQGITDIASSHDQARKDIITTRDQAIKDISSRQERANEDIASKGEQCNINIASGNGQAVKDITLNKTITHEKFKHDSVTEFKRMNENSYNAMLDDITELKLNVESIKKRLGELQKNVAYLNMIQDQRQTQLDLVQGRLDLRGSLVNFFQKHYVKTSACPLKPGLNDIYIGDVYIEPYMEKEIKDSLIPDQGKVSTIPVERYIEIFADKEIQFKRIYIIGNMGSGKSAFCKMFIAKWCNSVSKHRLEGENERGISTSTSYLNACDVLSAERTYSEDDLFEMLKFDFLFYLPLRRLSGYTDIVKMVQNYYIKEVPNDKVFDDVLRNCSERCFIIADGIDEWTPGQTELLPEHLTYGLPYDGGLKEATILMTSRPSAPGILGMQSTECDQKLFLRGIKGTSTKMLVRKYVSKLKDRDTVPATLVAIMNSLKEIKIHNLEQTPLLLQQIVWLLSTGSTIGESVSEVYSNLLNVALKWAEKKYPEKQITVSGGTFQCLRLPNQLEKYFDCKNNCNLIFTLGKLSFELFIQHKGTQMAFGRNYLIECGINVELIPKLLKTGLLTEENRFDPTFEDTQFSFNHISFLEYCGALFIASHRNQENDVSSKTKTASPFKDILARVFSTAWSIQDVFQLQNVLVLACGLAPEITHDLCEHIYQITSKEINCYYDSYSYGCNDCFSWAWEQKMWDIRDLVVQCISECRSNDGSVSLKVPLASIVMSDTVSDMLGYVDPIRMLYMTVSKISDRDIFTIKTFRNLQKICVVFVYLQQKTLTELCRFISVTSSLTSMYFEDIKCHNHDEKHCNHAIYLSRHSQLQHMCCMNTEILRFEQINTKRLELCTTNSADILRKVIPCNVLQQLYCCKNLKTLELYHMTLETKDMSKLINFINRTLSLRTLYLRSIKCDELRKGIDISNHRHLQTLKIRKCDSLYVKHFSKTKLELCETDSVGLERLLRKSKTLKTMKLHHMDYSRGITENSPYFYYFEELKHRGLLRGDDDGVLVINQEMKNLKQIEFLQVTMSVTSWCQFVDSLLTLSQSVTVHVYQSYEILHSGKDYVKGSPEKYDILEESISRFKFKTIR